jgi:ferric-dicitrate binding protein FerR (iron transport regulator)
MDEKRLLYLVSRNLTGEIDPSEKAELEEALHTNKEYQHIYQALFAEKVKQDDDAMLEAQQAYATHFVKMQLNGEFESKKIEVPEIIEEPVRRRLGVNIFWAAAASLVIAIASIGIIRKIQTKKEEALATRNEVTTKKGSKSKVVLPDGTLVWLNADSKILYAGNFDGSVREIQLSGEAFFDVVKDERRPFIIHTKTIDINVLGTAFNVRSYPNEKTTEASLIRGSIRVTLHNKEGKQIVLKPNEKLKVNNENMVVDSSSADPMTASKKQLRADSVSGPEFELDSLHFQRNDTTSIEALWINNKLAFESENLEVVVSKIERWYNVDVVIQNEQLKTKRFTAIFEHKSLTEVMEALRITGRFNYTIKNDVVFIY